MKTFNLFIAIIVAVLLTSCVDEYIESQTIAQRINISANWNGKLLKDGDLITIDQVTSKQSWTSINYKIEGLESGELVEVFNKYGNQIDERMPVGESYEIFSQERDTFNYWLDISHFANVFDSKDLTTTLKFKCSDGSEKWLRYPVKLTVDSTAYKPSFELKTSSYEDLLSSIVLNKGESLYVKVYMEVGIIPQTYVRIVSENYFNGQMKEVGMLTGYDDSKLLSSNVLDVCIPYEHDLTSRIVEFQIMGRYAKSDIKKVTILWK